MIWTFYLVGAVIFWAFIITQGKKLYKSIQKKRENDQVIATRDKKEVSVDESGYLNSPTRESMIQRLNDLKALKDSGVISVEEFEEEKTRILNTITKQ